MTARLLAAAALAVAVGAALRQRVLEVAVRRAFEARDEELARWARKTVRAIERAWKP